MSLDRINEIWKALDRVRGTVSPDDLAGLLDALREAGISVGPEELEMLLQRMPRKSSHYYFPIQLARFVADILVPYSPQSILDPWTGAGILSATIAEKIKPSLFDVFNKSMDAHQVLRRVAGDLGLNAQVGDPLSALAEDGPGYDAVVSCPAFGMRSAEPISVIIKEKAREIRDDYGHLLILRACQRLKEGGVGVFVVVPGFMLERRAANARGALHDLGFQVRACIEIPSGTFHPLTSIPTNLVVIERGEPGLLFVAEYSRDTRHQETIRCNFLERREGKRAAQGRLLPVGEFKSYSTLAASERLYNLAKRMGLEEVRFGSIVSEINPAKSGAKFERLPEKPNSVYLPLMAATPATTSQDRLPEKLKSYLQLVIKEDVADASFVAGLLNTSLGLAIRDAARRGVTIPRIDQRDLLELPFFLPPPDVQQKVVSAQAIITRLRNELNELESTLWAHPRSVDKIEAVLRNLNKEDRFQDWIDTLPFPLASVLWRYHAYKGAPREAYERLLAFFEVLTEFCAVVHLSAFSSNEALWHEKRKDLKALLSKQSLSLELSTFGTWKCCVEFLSSRARKMLHDSPELCFEMYRTHDRRVLEAITSKKLVGIMQEANSIRNSAYGHVGAVSETSAKSILAALTEHLGRVRETFGDIWASYELLKPLECKHRSGVFHYKSQRIMGTRSMPFETVEVVLTEAMEDGQLHLWSPGENRALRLLPMVKIMPSPKTEQNACYFYNRRQADGIRFLSYHFETDADIVELFEDTDRVLNTLFGAGA